MALKSIKNIIFDMGGVLLNINRVRCVDEFKKLGIHNANETVSAYTNSGIFHEIEAGTVTPETFYDKLRDIAGSHISNELLCNAWLSMIEDVPQHRLNLLAELQPRFNLYLLSNTNAIHYPAFDQQFIHPNGHIGLNQFFKHQFLSHQLHLSKPDPKIYEIVLSVAGISADETLFIDDGIKNIETAKALGFKTLHIEHSDEVAEKIISVLV